MDEINAARASGGAHAGAAALVRLLETDHLDDQMAALAWLRAQGFVDPARIAVGGNSFGGIETVLGVEREAYCAGLDLAGAAQTWSTAPELQERLKRAVRGARAPIFFFQARNDRGDLLPGPRCCPRRCEGRRQAVRCQGLSTVREFDRAGAHARVLRIRDLGRRRDGVPRRALPATEVGVPAVEAWGSPRTVEKARVSARALSATSRVATDWAVDSVDDARHHR